MTPQGLSVHFADRLPIGCRGGSQTRRWRCYRHRVAARVSFPSRSFPLTIYKSYQIFYF